MRKASLIDAAPFDCSTIDATLDNGVLRLEGVVPDLQAKRQAGAIARWLEGVIDVENALSIDASLVSEVTAALSSDHRTEVAIVGVINERGVISLKGEVDDPNTREAVEEIVRQQPGVVDVINDLEVKIDDPTELLRFRKMALESRRIGFQPGLEQMDD